MRPSKRSAVMTHRLLTTSASPWGSNGPPRCRKPSPTRMACRSSPDCVGRRLAETALHGDRLEESRRWTPWPPSGAIRAATWMCAEAARPRGNASGAVTARSRNSRRNSLPRPTERFARRSALERWITSRYAPDPDDRSPSARRRRRRRSDRPGHRRSAWVQVKLEVNVIASTHQPRARRAFASGRLRCGRRWRRRRSCVRRQPGNPIQRGEGPSH